MSILADALVPGIAIAQRAGDGMDGFRRSGKGKGGRPLAGMCPQPRKVMGGIFRPFFGVDPECDESEIAAGAERLRRNGVGHSGQGHTADVRAIVQHRDQQDGLAIPIASGSRAAHRPA